jgi:hypothetical protein
MSVAPYVDFGVKAEAQGAATSPAYRFRVDAGAMGAMHGRSDAFGIRPEDLERNLVEWKARSVLEGVAP